MLALLIILLKIPFLENKEESESCVDAERQRCHRHGSHQQRCHRHECHNECHRHDIGRKEHNHTLIWFLNYIFNLLFNWRTPAPPEGPPTFRALVTAVAAGNPRWVAAAHRVLSKKDHEVLGDSSGYRQWLQAEVTLWLPNDTWGPSRRRPASQQASKHARTSSKQASEQRSKQAGKQAILIRVRDSMHGARIRERWVNDEYTSLKHEEPI